MVKIGMDLDIGMDAHPQMQPARAADFAGNGQTRQGLLAEAVYPYVGPAPLDLLTP